MTAPSFAARLRELPLIAVLRGLTPDAAVAVGETLVEAGFRLLEVPLNSPRPFDSIEQLAKRFGHLTVGAGTVLSSADVDAVHASGGRLVVAPNLDESVVETALAHDMFAIPGVATPTEAFRGLAASASALKLFPAEMVAPAVVKAMRAVLPKDALLIPTGGIGAHNIADYWTAGANGFGTGSSLFRPDMSVAELATAAAAIVAACRALPLRD